jgi:hypothetical protein
MIGNINEFRVYNRSLSSTEINNIYNLSNNNNIDNNNNNYQLFNNITSANIYQKNLYAYFSGGQKIYDYTNYTTNLVDISYIFVGLINDDDVTISSIIGTFQQITHGQQFIDVSNIILKGFSSLNYKIINPPAFLSFIYKKGIIAQFTSIPKIYDYNNIATQYTFGTLSGIFGFDNVSINSFISKYRNFRVGYHIIDISNIIITDQDSFNYYVLPILPTMGYITPKPIDISFNYGTKIYDGLFLEYNLNARIINILGNDIVTISGFTTIFQTNQSGYQLIDISNFIITGQHSYNYYVPSIQAFMGYIRPKDLIISYINSSQKYSDIPYNNYNVTYNGLVSIDSPSSLSGILEYAISINNQYAISKNNIKPNQINWIMLGDGVNKIVYSEDGSNWYNSSSNVFTSYGSSAALNNNLWIALGVGENTIAYSYNGIDWSGLGTNIFNQIGLFVIYTRNMWIASGQGINTLAYSHDGLYWIGLGNNIFTNYCKNISANKDLIVAVGEGINTIAYSYDGINWNGLGNNIFDIKGSYIVNNYVIWVALGKGTINNMAYSYNGIYWYGLGTNIFTVNANSCIWDGSKFIAVGEGINTIAYSNDGIYWTGLGNSIFTIAGLGITFNGLSYIAIGSGINKYAHSTDGIIWTSVNFNINLTNPYFIESIKCIDYLYKDQVIDAGSYKIVPSGLYGRNYYIKYIEGITDINKTKLQITHNNYNKTYNAIPFSDFGVTYTGFMNNDTSMNLTGSLTFYYNDELTKVGQYTITPSGFVAINYDITYLQGKLQIIKAPLVIKANNNIKIYNKLSYIPSYTVYGLLQNDTIYDLSGYIIYNGTFQNNVNVGKYNVIPSGFYSNNYDIKFINGLVEITKAPLFIIANSDDKIYYNDISNYMLVYNPKKYILLDKGIISLDNDYANNLIWSLNGYEGPCRLIFNPPPLYCSIGLSVINSNITLSGIEKFIITTNIDITGYYLTINEQYETYNYDYVIPNDPNTIIEIKYENNMITYLLNNNIIRHVNKHIRNKLYLNILTYYNGDTITNIQFSSIKEYYYGGNGFFCDGFQRDDTINDLSGSIIYVGTSQGASDTGKYTIIPSGFTSNNYNIKYITGYLNIKKSLQN